MIQQSHTTGHIPRENHNSKRHMHPNVHRGTIYNSQVMEATYMPIDRRRDKEDVVHIYNGILLRHKKANIGEDMVKLESSYTAGGNVKLYRNFGKQSDSSPEV